MADDDQITLTCPLCRNQHVYPIAVERSLALGLMTPDMEPTERVRPFVRLFTCPHKATQFQATFRLRETPLNEIKSVKVGDPV
jgi:hypothetical protein